MTHHFIICADNKGYAASLEVRKLYEVLEDTHAEKCGQYRVVDESGEDYLYPKELFIPVHLPKYVESQLSKAA